MYLILFLLVVYQLKHFLADYIFQTEYMLGKFKTGWDWVKPLAAHCLVHGLFTWLIVYACTLDPIKAYHLFYVDFIVHFIMDRIKAGPRWLGRFKPVTAFEYHDYKHFLKYPDPNANLDETECRKALRSNKLFWWSLGFDQMIHHLTHYYIIWRIVKW